jgi:hypothetical protein
VVHDRARRATEAGAQGGRSTSSSPRSAGTRSTASTSRRGRSSVRVRVPIARSAKNGWQSPVGRKVHGAFVFGFDSRARRVA